MLFNLDSILSTWEYTLERMQSEHLQKREALCSWLVIAHCLTGHLIFHSYLVQPQH